MTEELYRGDTPEEIEAHKVFEDQLKLVREMITLQLDEDGKGKPPHWHFTDDCGEYFRGALELAADLASHREDGTAALLERLKELAVPTEPDFDDWYRAYDEYPTDSVCGEFTEWAKKQG